MNCPFPLPQAFRATKAYFRSIKRIPYFRRSELEKVIRQFTAGNPEEKYRPKKLKSNTDNLYRIKIKNYRLVYALEKEDSQYIGKLLYVEKRSQDYRKLKSSS